MTQQCKKIRANGCSQTRTADFLIPHVYRIAVSSLFFAFSTKLLPLHLLEVLTVSWDLSYKLTIVQYFFPAVLSQILLDVMITPFISQLMKSPEWCSFFKPFFFFLPLITVVSLRSRAHGDRADLNTDAKFMPQIYMINGFWQP